MSYQCHAAEDDEGQDEVLKYFTLHHLHHYTSEVVPLPTARTFIKFLPGTTAEKQNTQISIRICEVICSIS